MHRCVIGCVFMTGDPWAFLIHIQGCSHVAKWIGEWAREMVRKPDWRQRVGLRG